MKKIKGKITISRPNYSDGRKIISISIVDSLAGIEFLDLEIRTEDFAEAITGLGRVDCEFEARGLHNVGKKCESKRIEFKMPEHEYGDRDLIASELAKKEAGEGWIASSYFGSQNSFFRRDGEEWARTSASRWVHVDE